jgi:putative membrane protein
MRLILRWIITALALFVAAWVVPGIRVDGGGWVAYAAMAAVLGLLNAVVRPILKLLSCPLIILTLGLFVLVINTVVLWLAAYLVNTYLGVNFRIEDFGSAFLGSLIVSVVSVVLSAVIGDKD